ncbi:hypothetical protein K458DRAFT_385958 [Lentithecium fluviatile CBS 122367]|uniref:Extracellular membrane protein CFEM domain-containing protein n=1 Tax=Lentithecium fluviatile CBS 122367 TaxID=1168545 RepID=A0A6G1JAE5_9PLEO|nr:hypothetical protein K458DRAFT_385958 [Lentithecium fluviatile CBS 122367]
MPSLSSTLTSTVTLLATLTSAILQNDTVPSAMHGLSDCTRGILFPLLANSQCNPANFPCICTEVDRLSAADAVAMFCDFQVLTCSQQIAVVPPPVFNTTNVTSTTVVLYIATGTSNGTTGPFNNVTLIPIGPAVTNTVAIPTTDANGQPTFMTTEVVGPVAPTHPSEPSFTGAAAAVEVPEFGKGRTGFIAGAAGLMGLVFAEL